jgi:hypothetical protein
MRSGELMMDDDHEQRFFFVHVQRAAGTSVFARLKRHFAPEQIYPDDSDRAPGPPAPTLLVSHLRERYWARREEIRVVTGHFPLRTTERLGDRFVTMTVLREPVERTLSFLRHHQLKTPSDRHRALEELYEDPIRFHGLIHNNMVKMFSLTPDEMRQGEGLMTRIEHFDTARLESAKANLRGVDVLGLHDAVEAFCDELAERFSWRLGASVRANRTEPFSVPSSFRARIAADNAADVELYNYARTLCAQRHQAMSR